MKNTFLKPIVLFFASCMLITSCKKDYENKDQENNLLSKSQSKGDKEHYSNFSFYALADGITLDKFSIKSPKNVMKSKQISGLQSGEKLLAIDFRPATGQLYGVGSTSRLYVINQNTGVARMVGPGAFTPAINGNIVGFDFNPTVDRIRLVTNNGQNLRLNPETGTVPFTDGNINLNGELGPMIAAAAYENNVAGATTTTLYGIDIVGKKLYRVNPPNDGRLEEVGSLGLDISGEGGYDIDSKSNVGIAIFKVKGQTTLFTVNDETAKTNILATFKKNYTAIAIPTQHVAYAAGADNSLLIFNPNSSDAPVSKPITGLASGETIVGLDMRPVNGQLYALGSGSSIYTVNASSGAAALVGTLTTPLSGSDFGFDFNPAVDRIRIVSNTGQNLRVNPNDAATITDGSVNPNGSNITAVAYSNNFAGTTATVLYDIDAATDKLYRQDPPNNGTLIEIASLGMNVETMSGFDISGTDNKGYALLKSGGNTKLYKVKFDGSSNSGKEDDDDDEDDDDSDDKSGILSYKRNFPFAIKGFTIGLGF